MTADPADRRTFLVTEEQWNAFWEIIDSSMTRDLPRLRELFAREEIWHPDLEAENE